MKKCKSKQAQKKMKTKKGFYWHVYHDKLIDWCYDYQERVNYIKIEKPKNEIKTRLRLFKKVKAKLPKELVEAGKKYIEAGKKCIEAGKKYGEAGKKYCEAEKEYDEAWKKYGEAWKKYVEAWKKSIEAEKEYDEAIVKLQLEKLHEKECGCSEWNGEELVFDEE